MSGAMGWCESIWIYIYADYRPTLFLSSCQLLAVQESSSVTIRLNISPNFGRPVSLLPKLLSPKSYVPPCLPYRHSLWESLAPTPSLNPVAGSSVGEEFEALSGLMINSVALTGASGGSRHRVHGMHDIARVWPICWGGLQGGVWQRNG